MWLVWAMAARAGELYVASAVPVHVWIDGANVPFQPGTLTVRMSGTMGVHQVQVGDGNGRLLAETQVQIPHDGVRTVTYDGVSLVITAPAPSPVVVMPMPIPSMPAPAPAPEPAGPTAMSSQAYAGLVAAVRSGTYADDQLAAIRTAAGRNWFTVEQLGGLLDLMTYGSDQVKAVQICASKVVDPENAFALGSHFTYSSDKEAALALFQ
jgi:hypothetical protein